MCRCGCLVAVPAGKHCSDCSQAHVQIGTTRLLNRHVDTPSLQPQANAAAQDDMNALHFAATKGHSEVIKFLLRPSELFG